MARLAAALMLSGVSKSGSPAPRPMTSRPAAFSSRALLVTAMVGDGLMRSRRSAMKGMGGLGVRVENRAGPYLDEAPGATAKPCKSALRPMPDAADVTGQLTLLGRLASRENHHRHAAGHRPGEGRDGFVQQQGRKAEAEEGLQQLQLPDPRRTAQGQA